MQPPTKCKIKHLFWSINDVTVVAIAHVELDFHISVSQLGGLGSGLWKTRWYPRQEDNLLGLLSLLALTSVSPWSLSGAVCHHWARRQPKVNPWKVRASFLQHRQGFSRCLLINSCLWGSWISLESVSGGQGKEPIWSCHFCPHLPHLIHCLWRKFIIFIFCFLWPFLSVSLAVPFHLIRAVLRGNTLSQRELKEERGREITIVFLKKWNKVWELASLVQCHNQTHCPWICSWILCSHCLLEAWNTRAEVFRKWALDQVLFATN